MEYSINQDLNTLDKWSKQWLLQFGRLALHVIKSVNNSIPGPGVTCYHWLNILTVNNFYPMVKFCCTKFNKWLHCKLPKFTSLK